MKKNSIIILIFVALVALLISAGLAVAKSAIIKFKVEMCRVIPSLVAGEVTCPSGTPIMNEYGIITGCEEDGRWHVRGAYNKWNVTQDDEVFQDNEDSEGDYLVVGENILFMNINCYSPPPLTDNDCTAWGTFELRPDAYPNGSWVGTWAAQYHDGEYKARFEGYGTGDLEGLKITAIDSGPIEVNVCNLPIGVPRSFSGSIHSPHGVFPEPE